MAQILIKPSIKHLGFKKIKNNDLIGYYEIEKQENKEFELINMGVLDNFRSNNFGALLLKHVIKQSQSEKAEKVWFTHVRLIINLH